jgi:hypothetical protein
MNYEKFCEKLYGFLDFHSEDIDRGIVISGLMSALANAVSIYDDEIINEFADALKKSVACCKEIRTKRDKQDSKIEKLHE